MKNRPQRVFDNSNFDEVVVDFKFQNTASIRTEALVRTYSHSYKDFHKRRFFNNVRLYVCDTWGTCFVESILTPKRPWHTGQKWPPDDYNRQISASLFP